LSVGKNKENLSEFLFAQWSTDQFRIYARKLGSRVLYVTHGEYCSKLCVIDDVMQCTDAPELVSSQEEADTRLLLHAYHASQKDYPAIVIKSCDTDVFVLALYYASELDVQLYLHTGNRQRTRYVDLTQIATRLGEAICDALPGLHALTGCDTTSSFSGRGKVRGLKAMIAYPVHMEALSQLGSSFEVFNVS
jgi:hypothetical protein